MLVDYDTNQDTRMFIQVNNAPYHDIDSTKQPSLSPVYEYLSLGLYTMYY
jgi:hypothetical protein